MQQIFRDIEVRGFVRSCAQVILRKTEFTGLWLITKHKILEKSCYSPRIFNVETYIWSLCKAKNCMVHQWIMKPSELFCFKDTKNFAALLFFLAACNKKFQRANATDIARMETIHPTIGWRRDVHGTHKHAHGSCMDSLICITCSLENNAFSVLHYVMVALHYSVTLIRDFFCPWKNHPRFYQAAALQPRVFARLFVGNYFC